MNDGQKHAVMSVASQGSPFAKLRHTKSRCACGAEFSLLGENSLKLAWDAINEHVANPREPPGKKVQPCSVVKNKSTEKGREFWDHVETVAAQVRAEPQDMKLEAAMSDHRCKHGKLQTQQCDVCDEPSGEKVQASNPYKELADMLQEAGAIPVINGVRIEPQQVTVPEEFKEIYKLAKAGAFAVFNDGIMKVCERIGAAEQRIRWADRQLVIEHEHAVEVEQRCSTCGGRDKISNGPTEYVCQHCYDLKDLEAVEAERDRLKERAEDLDAEVECLDKNYAALRAEHDRLKVLAAHRKEINEMAREHSREIRDAVAEARWADRQEGDYGSY